MGRIVVGVDGSPGSATALRWAVREGMARGWTVEATYVWSYLDQRHVRGARAFDPEYGEEDAAHALEYDLVKALGTEGAAGVVRRLENDHPAHGLLAAATGADLLVVGARGHGGFLGLRVGSVSMACASDATCPVAVVRSLPDDAHPRVVVGVDGSSASLEAVDWARDHALASGAEVEVVSAWRAVVPASPPFSYVPVDYSMFEQACRRLVDAEADRLRAAGVPATATVVAGQAASALLSRATDGDLLVVGSRGEGGFARLLLGSTSHQVLKHAECSVVIVRAEGTNGPTDDVPGSGR